MDPAPLVRNNLPTSIQLDLDKDPETVGPWYDFQNGAYQTRGFCGYRYPDEICHWFSVAIDREVILIRAASKHRCRARLGKFVAGRKDDQVKSFTSEAPLSIVNDASICDLRNRVLEKKEVNSDFYLEREQFRAPIAVDLGTPWLEDSLAECRIGPILLRYCGPAIRCDCIRMDYRKNCFLDKREPYATLSTFRSLPGWGALFAAYVSCDLLTSKEEYEAALPPALGYQSYSDSLKANPHQRYPNEEDMTYIRIYKHDYLYIRVQKEPKLMAELRLKNEAKSI